MSTSPADSARGPRAPLPVRLLPPLIAVVLVLVAVWVVAGSSLSLPQLGAPSSAPRAGARAPDFALTTADGKTVKLSDLRGKRVVLNFWATWCPPCRAETPDLDRIAHDLRDQGVEVVAVDQLESPDKVASFLSEVGIGTSPSIVPVFDSEGTVAESYRVTALPSTFLIDGDGVIRDVTLGPIAESTLRAKLERIK
jgi:DsbE subfamily thiol:disulfide oxidoreductase